MVLLLSNCVFDTLHIKVAGTFLISTHTTMLPPGFLEVHDPFGVFSIPTLERGIPPMPAQASYEW